MAWLKLKKEDHWHEISKIQQEIGKMHIKVEKDRRPYAGLPMKWESLINMKFLRSQQ